MQYTVYYYCISQHTRIINLCTFEKIGKKFESLTPEQQEKLKARAESLSEEEKERLNNIAGKYLRGEELTEDDLANIDVIVETTGGVEVSVE